MGAGQFMHCLPAVRPVMLALLAAVGWLVWGAGTANASTPLHDGGALHQNAPPPLVQIVPPTPSNTGHEAATALATASTLDSPVGEVLVSPVGEAADALAAPAAPVLTGAANTVAVQAPELSDTPLLETPQLLPLADVLPLPAELPPLLVSSAPVPVPLTQVDLILLPTTGPLVGPIPAPSALPVPIALPPSTVLDSAGPGLPAAPLDSTTAAAADAAESSAANTLVLTFGGAPVLELRGAAAVPAAVPGSAAPIEAPRPPDPLWVTAGGSGTSSSSGGSDGAADRGRSWPAHILATGSADRIHAESTPAGPSFDPGSTPD